LDISSFGQINQHAGIGFLKQGLGTALQVFGCYGQVSGCFFVHQFGALQNFVKSEVLRLVENTCF